MRQFLAACYPADLEESLAAAPGEVESIDLFSGDLKFEADWDLPIRRDVLTYVVEPVSVANMAVFLRRLQRLVITPVCQLWTYCRWCYAV